MARKPRDYATKYARRIATLSQLGARTSQSGREVTSMSSYDTHSSMNEPMIVCPNCKSEIRLTESLAAPLIEATRAQFEHKIAEMEADIAKREAAISEQRAETQRTQLDLLRNQREFDDAKRDFDLTVEEKVQESLMEVRDKAKQEAEDEQKLKLLEKDELIASMQRHIGDLKRKVEQGSQQLQGEALELELESILRAKFPRDIIEPVAKGDFGGDVLQTIIGPLGQNCGLILWESKRTKKFSDSWLPKLRDDQRTAKADIALIVSTALPPGTETFDLMEGIWVTGTRCAIPLAIVLRKALIEVSAARKANEGQQTKMEMVFQYMTGPCFRHRFNAIVDKFSEMQADLDKERKTMTRWWATMTRWWAKREAQIRVVIESTAGMYGDLQGIAGRELPEIDSKILSLDYSPKPASKK